MWVREVFTHQDHAAAWATEGLVCGGGDDVAVIQWVVQQTAGDETSRVGDVGHEDSANLVGDSAHAFKIPVA